MQSKETRAASSAPAHDAPEGQAAGPAQQYSDADSAVQHLNQDDDDNDSADTTPNVRPCMLRNLRSSTDRVSAAGRRNLQ